MSYNSKNIFIITSVLSPSKKALSYTPVRSIFSYQERLDQTIQTVESVLEKDPECEIHLVEWWHINRWDSFKSIHQVRYHYIGDKFWIRWCIDSSNKSLGEVIMLLYWICVIRIPLNKFWMLIKISGRYFLNDMFNPSNFALDKISFRILGAGCSTKLYAVPKAMFTYYIVYLFMTVPLLLLWRSIECTLYFIVLRRHIHMLWELGISGWDGTNWKSISE